MHGSHESPLVALSILIAICASYTALTLAGRVAVARGTARVAWLLGGGGTLGGALGPCEGAGAEHDDGDGEDDDVSFQHERVSRSAGRDQDRPRP